MADSFVSKEYLQKQFQNYSTVVKDNFEKKGAVTAETLKYTNVKVQVCNKLVADYCKEQGCEYLIRGLRNTTDYLYEENVASINTEINPNIKTIYFRTRNEVLSSTFVKELYKYGKDITKYLPKEIHL